MTLTTTTMVVYKISYPRDIFARPIHEWVSQSMLAMVTGVVVWVVHWYPPSRPTIAYRASEKWLVKNRVFCHCPSVRPRPNCVVPISWPVTSVLEWESVCAIVRGVRCDKWRDAIVPRTHIPSTRYSVVPVPLRPDPLLLHRPWCGPWQEGRTTLP